MTSRSVIDEIKGKLDIVEIISAHVPLAKAGKYYRAGCPFHGERTPSFFVFPHEQRWWCFGACSEGGDVFDFVQKQNGWDFNTALRELAPQAGVSIRPLTEEQQAKGQERRDYEAALGLAAGHFARKLLETPSAVEYVRSRGWSDETARSELLGYADGKPLPDLGNHGAQALVENLNRWAGKVGGALLYAHRRKVLEPCDGPQVERFKQEFADYAMAQFPEALQELGEKLELTPALRRTFDECMAAFLNAT